MSGRRDVAFVMEQFQRSERDACRLVGVDRSSYRYTVRPDRNEKLRGELKELARQKPRFGYRRLWVLLSVRQPNLSITRVYRLYRSEHLMVRRLKRKRLPPVACVNALLKRPNQEWAIDLLSDRLSGGRGIRVLTIVDGFTRQCPALKVAPSLSSQRVTRALEKAIGEHGAPQSIRCDNGPEFTSRHFLQWCEQRSITIIHIQPGRPMQKAYVSNCTSSRHCGMTAVEGRRRLY